MKVIDRNLNQGTEEQRKALRRVKNQFFQKENGDPSRWTEEIIRNAPIQGLTKNDFKKLDPQVMKAQKSRILNVGIYLNFY